MGTSCPAQTGFGSRCNCSSSPKARILLPRRSRTKSLPLVHQADSSIQDVSAKQNKYSHIWREHVLHSPLTTLGCKIKRTLKRPQNMKLQRCTFAESICHIFNHPGDLNLILFFFWPKDIHWISYHNQTGYKITWTIVVYDTYGTYMCFLCVY